ncbi:hypothetical protein tinsulaeT_35780 [Thalassotalea insulae]|uniref:Bacterial repeat domain-containing protein n=1 Tax=Thalassotalea insulae TaxID=2056778 RepID=A0ABQ6GWD1_9GAMM|nr:hypothetical protein [Thalassotalea insulae]GLX80238.1 hypothetical protein tinsulaeT_35780 [Thalassotalea insulae]
MYKKLLVTSLGFVLIGCGGSSSGEKETSTQPIIKSYEVSASASTGGMITPTNQSIQSGNKATLNISADDEYEIDSVAGCNGSLNDNVYTTSVITADCEVSATFKLKTYTVSATTSDGGVMTPTNQFIQSGHQAILNVSPDEGYEIDSVAGCNGSLSDKVYTTGVITADCEVSATFKLKIYTVSSLIPDGGVLISPVSQTITHGDVAVFNIEQNTGIGKYEISGCSGYIEGSTYTIDAVTSDCQISAEFNGDFLGLSLYPQHEDSSIAVSIDLTQTDVPNTELTFVIYKENNVEYYSSENAGRITYGSIRMPISKKVYRKVVPNLKPDSEYEICMSGINNFKPTGFFGCKKIKTAQKKTENALIVINHDVESEAIALINEWVDKVESKNSHIKLKTHNLQSETTAETIKLYLENEYNSSNLRHVVFIGYDIPSLTTKVSNTDTKLLGLYSSLSEVERGDWHNEDQTNADEVTIAAIKPQDITISTYLHRLINFYDGGLVYPQNVLLADAMIASEKSFVRSDFENLELEIDMVTGFESNIELSEAIRWQDEYSNKLLENEYGLLFIGAHGSRLEHYPCGYECINYNFIKEAEPKVKFTIAISCNIGHVFTENSPMLSYIFGPSSGSLSGLASEVLYFDNGSSARRIIHAFKEREMSIGEVSRIFGFLVVGDPFLTLN